MTCVMPPKNRVHRARDAPRQSIANPVRSDATIVRLRFAYGMQQCASTCEISLFLKALSLRRSYPRLQSCPRLILSQCLEQTLQLRFQLAGCTVLPQAMEERAEMTLYHL